MPTTDEFRPNLPLDPFDDQNQWSLDADVVNTIAASRPDPLVILVLGEPSQDALQPLLLSSHLSDSLLLFVTHSPPDVSELTPSVSAIVLRTQNSISTAEMGALQLLSILERAAAVAAKWRSSSHTAPRCQQFTEMGVGGDFSISETFGNHHQAPSDAAVPVIDVTTPPRSRNSIASLKSLASSQSRKQSKSRSAITDAPQSFDAILNFIPALPERIMLKRAILVTTTAQPYLASRAARPSPPLTNGRHKSRAPNRSLPIFSWLAKSSESLPTALHARPASISQASVQSRYSFIGLTSGYSTPATSRSESPFSAIGLAYLPGALPLPRSHLLHILPSSRHTSRKSKLVHSLEQFLVSYSSSESSTIAPGSPRSRASSVSSISSSTSSIMSSASIPTSTSGFLKPVPYILPGAVLGHKPATGKGKARQGTITAEGLSIFELLLLGAMDSRPSAPPTEPMTLSRMSMIAPPRAWIGDGEDVTIDAGAHDADAPPLPTSESEVNTPPSSWSPRKSASRLLHGSPQLRKSSSANALSAHAKPQLESVSTSSSSDGGLPDSTPATSAEDDAEETASKVDLSVDAITVTSHTTSPTKTPKTPKSQSTNARWKFWKSRS